MKNESVQDLFPALTEEEQRIAEEQLDRYLELAWEIAHSVRDEHPLIDG